MYLKPGAEGKQMLIDPEVCTGCAFCVQWCDCIRPVGKK
jgi:NAD-dependent dihydropyrimidine dehydrogenase PreA subunit